MHHLWKKGAAIGFLAFLGLWIAGAVGGFAPPAARQSPPAVAWRQADAPTSSRQAFANNVRELGLARAPLPLLLDQADIEQIRVHEKSARVVTGADGFDDDEGRIREALEGHQAVVFNVTKGGIAPERHLTLEVGVPPEQFDALAGRLRGIGRLESVSVEEHDRTGELRQLHARRQSLKKHLEAVRKLHGRGDPTIDDSLKVEQKIQDIEREMQALGVQVGDFLGAESLYRVTVTLVEYPPGAGPGLAPTLARRFGLACLWAAVWWAALAVMTATLLVGYLSVRTLARPTPA